MSDEEKKQDDPPVDEELSDSLRPAPPPIPSVRPSQRPHPSPTTNAAPEQGASATPFADQLRKARNVGTGIWYAGVFLWSYIVVGEYVIGAKMPEFFGWSLFAGLVVGAFLHGANRIGSVAMGKVAAVSVVAVVGATLFLSSIVGSSYRSDYQTVSVFFMVVAVALIFFGRRHARGGLPQRPRKGVNWPRVGVWVLFAGNTALITLALVSQI